MLNVDIFIPTLTPFRKYQNYSFPTYKWNSYWFPVWYYKKELKNMGINVRFLHDFGRIFRKKTNFSKIVGIDCKFLGTMVRNKEELLSTLKVLKKKTDYLIWFDNTASTGTTRFEVLPYVDRYLKRSILKDRTFYTKNSFKKESRIYINFYNKEYKLDKLYNKKNEFLNYTPLDPKYNHKVSLSWNLALTDYRFTNSFNRFLYGFTRKNEMNFCKPSINRKILLSANFSYKITKPKYYFQRHALLKFLKEKYKSNQKISIGKMPKKDYLINLRKSKSICSPFGWGEICFRDFEAFIAGAALIKPDMDHVETWPNLYKKQDTYIPISWKIENWDNEFNEILANKTLLYEVAKNGQNIYKRLWTKEGKKAFCERFYDFLTFK